MGRPYGNCRGGDRTTSRGAGHGWWRGVVQHRGEVEHQERSTLGAAGAGAVVVDSGRGAGCATVGAAAGATIIALRSGKWGRFAAGVRTGGIRGGGHAGFAERALRRVGGRAGVSRGRSVAAGAVYNRLLIVSRDIKPPKLTSTQQPVVSLSSITPSLTEACIYLILKH
jgi:hypothetical protein